MLHHNYFFVFERKERMLSVFSICRNISTSMYWWPTSFSNDAWDFKSTIYLYHEIKAYKKGFLLNVCKSKSKIISKQGCFCSSASKCRSVFLCLRWPHHPDSRSKSDLEPLAPAAHSSGRDDNCQSKLGLETNFQWRQWQYIQRLRLNVMLWLSLVGTLWPFCLFL